MAGQDRRDEPLRPERVERTEPEPRWEPIDDVPAEAFPIEGRMRQKAKHEAVKVATGEKYKPNAKPKKIEFGNDD
eukprot:9927399-Prorocentrum_lima.AAC.1